jgi:hypothetical protein
MKERMRVAIAHDWLTGMRGGEKVLEAICRLFPQAELFTLVHRRRAVSATIESRAVHRSLVDRLPLSATRYREYLPLFPFAIEQFNFDRFDLVISSSHCAAKSVVVPGRTAHVCYCHSPILSMLRAGSADTIIARPASFIRLSTRTSSSRMRPGHELTT